MKISRIVGLIALAMIAAGCSPPKLVNDPQLVQPAPIAIPAVKPMALKPVHFNVEAGTTPKIILTKDNYKALAEDEAEFLRWASDEKALARFLESVLPKPSK